VGLCLFARIATGWNIFATVALAVLSLTETAKALKARTEPEKSDKKASRFSRKKLHNESENRMKNERIRLQRWEEFESERLGERESDCVRGS